jgi:hypothetical protein
MSNRKERKERKKKHKSDSWILVTRTSNIEVGDSSLDFAFFVPYAVTPSFQRPSPARTQRKNGTPGLSTT